MKRNIIFLKEKVKFTKEVTKQISKVIMSMNVSEDATKFQVTFLQLECVYAT